MENNYIHIDLSDNVTGWADKSRKGSWCVSVSFDTLVQSTATSAEEARGMIYKLAIEKCKEMLKELQNEQATND